MPCLRSQALAWPYALALVMVIAGGTARAGRERGVLLPFYRNRWIAAGYQQPALPSAASRS
jgi:hypothetical protein